ncbi:hypothetical protein Rhe02_57260 [Rhizocola hellebori]|uniref:Uncharacterized protein n=1 Tax=Rhizocola hellebori TaxID=1392758 RepID=A0A8J3VHQ8_9ACTN|nr:DUF630 domain-containing protein [Rhizocola hellebori]GIH07659.1 hypothetical protein Rhe02_57260 [Rhizocola hellebori]
MPFAEDYDVAANALEAAAQEAASMMESARAALGTGVMVGGQLTRLVTDELDAAAGILDQVSSELTELVATCRERAEICRQAQADQHTYAASYTRYQADLRDWQDHHGTREPAPEPPTAPEAAPAWANR